MSSPSFQRRVAALHRMLDAAAGAFGGLMRDARGSIATTFALGLIPISLAVGAAVDYSYANKAKAQFNAAADAAALAAVSKFGTPQTTNNAKKTALNEFNAYASTIKRATLGSVKASITDTTAGRTAVVTYTATVPTSVMGIMGIKNLTITGSSTAASALPARYCSTRAR